MDCSEMEEEYDSSQSKLLEDFMIKIGFSNPKLAMFAMSQANLLANKRRKFLLSTQISKERRESVRSHWAPFPIEMCLSAFTLSPSALKLLVVRNSENEPPTQFEVWSSSPQRVHGSVYVDGWFEGISWNSDETHVAYVAEEPSRSKPTFNHLRRRLGKLERSRSLGRGLGRSICWKK
ncbi:unnamed protein product [Thlaspi arvense]|uniref:Acylamino-acid-releasing enzyme N-terminal domain-containing protein n=1 Tax=Thlaspi arvense TaxID=13288 RepID=A0AAU9RWY8_THLAR|nr:unnamed protein product [Thlaspi arvense]